MNRILLIYIIIATPVFLLVSALIIRKIATTWLARWILLLTIFWAVMIILSMAFVALFSMDK